MQKSIIIALTLVMVSVIGVLLWIRSTDLSDPAAPSGAIATQAKTEPSTTTKALAIQHGTDDQRTEIAPEPLTNAAASGVHADTLSVRSSIGLALPFIEWEAREADWQRIDLDCGRCKTATMTLPCLVRAPGHVAVTASRVGEEIVLEPDALIYLESSGLHACTDSIEPVDPFSGEHMRPEVRNALAWGWISEDRWAFAVSSALAADALGDHPVEAVLYWRDGRRADIHFLAHAQARASWAVPCEDIVVHAPLDVHFVRPAQDATGRIALGISRIVEGDPPGRHEDHPWGSVEFYAPESFWRDVTVPAGVDGWTFSTVPTGVPISVAARDEASGAYGRLEFVHDGTPRTLELRPAFKVTARLVSGATSSPISTTDVWWHFMEGSEVVWGWQAEARAVALAPDGGFVLRGPSNPPLSRETPLDPPSHLLIHVDAPGYESFERMFDTGGASSFDCGELRLTPVRAEIVLAPGHGLSPKAIRWEGLTTSGSPSLSWNVRDAAPLADGALGIFLVRSEENPKLLESWPTGPRAWPVPSPHRFVIQVLLESGDEPWAFERGADGRYVAAPRRQHEIEVECRAPPPEGGSWTIGWQWHELGAGFAGGPSLRPGHPVRLHFSAPEAATAVYWSADGNPPREGKGAGGSVPFSALPEKLVIP